MKRIRGHAVKAERPKPSQKSGRSASSSQAKRSLAARAERLVPARCSTLQAKNKELRETLHRLKEARNKYSAFYDFAPVGYLAIDDRGFVREANRKASRMLGVGRSKLVNTRFTDWVCDDDQARFKRHQKEVFTTRAPATCTVRLKPRRRSPIPVQVESLFKGATNGGGRLFLAALLDRTDQLKSEAALKSQASRLEQTGRIARVGTWEWDIVRDNVTWSDEVNSILGLPRRRTRLKYEGFLQMVHPEDRSRVDVIMQRARKDGKPFGFFHRVVPGKHEKTLHCRGAVEFDAVGVPVKMMGVSQDVTELKETEKVRRENQERLQRLSAASFEGVAITKDGILLEANQQLAKIHGYRLEEIIGKPVRKFVHPDDYERAMAAMSSGVEAVAEFREVKKDGSVIIVEAHGQETTWRGQRVRVSVLRDITARKQSEGALREHQRRLSLAMSAGKLAPWEIDLASGEVKHSPELLQLFGIDPNAPPDSRNQWRSLIPREDRRKIRKSVEAARAGHEHHMEYRVRHPDGTIHWHETHGTAFEDADTGHVRLVGFAWDITQRKRDEEHFSFLADVDEVFFHASSADEIMQIVGRKTCTHLGVRGVTMGSVDAPSNTLTLEFGWRNDNKPPPFRPGVYRLSDFADPAFIRAGRAGKVVVVNDVHANIHTKSDSYESHAVRAFVCIPFHAAREWKGVFVVSNRVPREWRPDEIALIKELAGRLFPRIQRAKAESALRLERERLEANLINSPMATIEFDSAQRIQRWSGAAEATFGWSAEEVLGKARQELRWVHEDDAAAVEKVVEDLKSRRRECIILSNRNYRKDGSVIHCEWYNSALYDQQGQLTSFFSRVLDVTEHKEMIRTIVEARAQLQHHAENLEKTVRERTEALRRSISEIEHFSYTITHDMRAPLRAMQGFGQILASQYADLLDDQGKDFIRRICQAALRMDHLITDALSYSKTVRSDLKLQPVDIRELLLEMVESYPQLQPPVANILIDGSIPYVMGNQAALTQCFSNLLCNAVKFVAPGRTPEVRVWAELRSGQQPLDGEQETDPSGIMVRVWFEDNGIGIPTEYQKQIWAMFQKLDNRYEGTGVGLALVKKVVERMNGAVGVVSEKGKGSRFWVALRKA